MVTNADCRAASEAKVLSLLCWTVQTIVILIYSLHFQISSLFIRYNSVGLMISRENNVPFPTFVLLRL